MKKVVSKKKYKKPIIDICNIDCDISLIMMTAWQPGDGKPPGPPGQGKKTSASNNTVTQAPTDSAFDENPFGN